MRSRSGRVWFVDPAECSTREMLHGRGTIRGLVTPSVGAHSASVQLVTIRPGTGSGPEHFHSASENIIYVLEGEALVLAGSRELIVLPDQAVFIPPRVPHSVSNARAAVLRLLEIYAPADADFVSVADA